MYYIEFVPLFLLMGGIVLLTVLAGGKKDKYPRDAVPN